MKPSKTKLTAVQKKLMDAYQPVIDKAVENEIDRIIEMSKGCAEACTAKAQEYLNSLQAPIEKVGRSIVDRNIAYYSLLYNYKSKVLKLKYYSLLDRSFDRSFTSSHDIERRYDGKKELLTDENKGDYEILFSHSLFNKAMVEYEREYRAMMYGKLERSITKYVTPNFISVSNIELKAGAEGYEVRCTLKDKAGFAFSMYTRAINAGGHNIQCFHYRYITKIK